MKKIKFSLIGTMLKALPMFALLGLLLTSCEIDDSINNSPNAINEESIKSKEGIEGLIVSLQVCYGDFYQRDRSRVSSVWSWQMCTPLIARPQFQAYNSYSLRRDGEVDDMWILGYKGFKIASDIINYAPLVDNFGADNEKIQNTLVGMAKTYKAMFIAELAANYGSIPIEIKGLDPAMFATQKQAYQAAQTLLNEAVTNFADCAPLTRDLNFKGDGAKWTAVVHSLKARYHLHMKEYDQAKTHAAQGIADAAGNLVAKFSETAGEWSAWGYMYAGENEPFRPDFTFIRLLKSEPGDLRLAKYFTPGEEAEGEYYGFNARKAQDTSSTVEEDDIKKCAHMNLYTKYSESFPLITVEENILILAECKARTGDVPGAITDVNLIRKQNGLEDFAGSTQEEAIAEILKQKHLELYLQGQSYHDMRRTGTLPYVSKWDGSKSNLRWIYPESEINSNPNVPADADNLVNDLLFDGYK